MHCSCTHHCDNQEILIYLWNKEFPSKLPINYLKELALTYFFTLYWVHTYRSCDILWKVWMKSNNVNSAIIILQALYLSESMSSFGDPLVTSYKSWKIYISLFCYNRWFVTVCIILKRQTNYTALYCDKFNNIYWFSYDVLNDYFLRTNILLYGI
jgi:hypothetical protein